MTGVQTCALPICEITELAGVSVAKADDAGARIEGLIPDILKTAEFAEAIAAATREQSIGANEVVTFTSRLDQTVQRNSAASEELSSTAEELAAQAQHLSESISFFDLDGRKPDAAPEAPLGIGPGDGTRALPPPVKAIGKAAVAALAAR